MSKSFYLYKTNSSRMNRYIHSSLFCKSYGGKVINAKSFCIYYLVSFQLVNQVLIGSQTINPTVNN